MGALLSNFDWVLPAHFHGREDCVDNETLSNSYVETQYFPNYYKKKLALFPLLCTGQDIWVKQALSECQERQFQKV